jgi:DNA-binding transcriptional LysR family regulator
LGTRLFDRLGRTARLTQLGEAFLPRAEAIVRQVADAKLEIQEMAGAERGRLVLVIGAIPTIAPYFLPSCLASFARKFPRVQISVVEGVTSELLNLIHEGASIWPARPAGAHDPLFEPGTLSPTALCGRSREPSAGVGGARSSFTNRKRSIPLAERRPLLSREHVGGLRTRPPATQCGFRERPIHDNPGHGGRRDGSLGRSRDDGGEKRRLPFPASGRRGRACESCNSNNIFTAGYPKLSCVICTAEVQSTKWLVVSDQSSVKPW